MEQLELAEQDILQPGTANAKVFAQQASKLAHEAELVAVFAETLVQEGMDEADDEEYRLYASMMRDAAVRVAESAREAQYEPGRAAVGDLTKSCSACHDVFR